MAIEVFKPELVSHDKRGVINRIVGLNKAEIRSVLRITILPKSDPRGNHWHRHDTHWVYVESGTMKYSEANQKTPGIIESVILKPGHLVVSKPGRIHAMEAVGKTEVVFFAITTEPRDTKHYEEDTIRIKIV